MRHSQGDQALGQQGAVFGAPLVELEGDLVPVVSGGAVEPLHAGELQLAGLVVLVTAWRPDTHADSLARLAACRATRPSTR